MIGEEIRRRVWRWDPDLTLIDVLLTVPARPSCGTVTLIVADKVLAEGTILTRVGVTLIQFNLTLLPHIAHRAGAVEVCHQVPAGRIVMTRLRRALVDVNLTR